MQMLVNYLGRYPEKIVSPLGQHRLMLAAVDCVWYVSVDELFF